MQAVNDPDQVVVDNREAIFPDKESIGRVAILTADKVEDVEFFYPYYRFTEQGYIVDVLTPGGGKLEAYKSLSLQHPKPLKGAKPEDYVLLYIPGGLAPTELRENEDAIKFVQAFAASGKLIGAVCHGPQLLISAGLVKGRKMTSWREVAPEITAAGGTYVDEAIVEDEQFITSRKPGDLPRQFARLFERIF